MKLTTSLLIVSSVLVLSSPCSAQLVISGNENKIDLSGGAQQTVPGAKPDSLTFLDFATFPPKVQHVIGVSNTVIGPPSNIAITPDRRVALVADSLKIDPADPSKTVPANRVHIVDLTVSPPKVVGSCTAGEQPSGMSITSDGKFAIVANRADGTVSVLSINGQNVRQVQQVKVCEKDEQASDVAITPDDRRGLVSINMAGYLRLLEIADGHVTVTERKFATFGKPYRCVVTPDGELAVTAGSGGKEPPDADGLSIIDLKAEPARTSDYIAIGSGPESFEVSPDGKQLAVVLMNGSNLPSGHPLRTEEGQLLLLKREGRTFVATGHLPIGRIPEGVAYTSDGKYLVVQCHAPRELWVFRRDGEKVVDTGHRIPVPGFPSSLRAAK